MKRSLLILLGSSSLYITTYAQAQSDSLLRRQNLVKLNPLSLLVADVSLFYERVLTSRTSLVAGVGFGSENFSYSKTPSPGQFTYQRLTLEYRRYLNNQTRPAPSGFYVGVYSRYAQLKLADYIFDEKGQFITDQAGQFVKETRQVNVWMPGVMVGFQSAPRRLVLDLFAGLQYQLPSSGNPLRSVTPLLMSKQQLTPRLGLAVGYRF